MYVKPKQLVNLVKNENDAKQIIVDLLDRFASQTAKSRVANEARFAKQSFGEVLSRSVGNLLNSFVTRKPGGYVD